MSGPSQFVPCLIVQFMRACVGVRVCGHYFDDASSNIPKSRKSFRPFSFCLGGTRDFVAPQETMYGLIDLP